MKKILVFPRFFELAEMHRAYATNSIGEMLVHFDLLPLMPFYHTEVQNLEEGYIVADKLLDHFDIGGIVLQGGNDIHPSLYGEDNIAAREPQSYRDFVEYGVVRIALERGIPLFGICRGMQMINVALGGTLHQHLEAETWGVHMQSDGEIHSERDIDRIQHTHHEVLLEKGGVLHRLFDAEAIRVNSYHHQGISLLGEGLRVEALTSDHLVEAFFHETKPIFGVQWHPELAWREEIFFKPFAWWVRECVG